MKSTALRLPVKATLPVILLIAMAQPTIAQDGRTSPALPAAPTSTASIDVPKLKFTEFTLANGLRVILHEDHSSPVVSVQLLYHVGSKNDVPGKSGLAHMFEHMLDEGSLNMGSGEFRRIVQEAGGVYEAHTQNDWTQYLMTLPSNQLETALWLEAERMANLSPTLDSARFNSEREAVRNEYREMFLNIGVQSGGEAMFEALFANSAYQLPLIGHMSELGSATVSDLRRFYDTYYVPNNAVLSIAGDFKTADARRMIERHFRPIPRGKPIVQPANVPPLSGEKRIVVEHSSGLRQLWFGWRGASAAGKDRGAALALSSILSDRLRRLLVTDRKLATSVPAAFSSNYDLEASGVLQTVINVSGSATEVERLVDSVVASIRTNGVTDTEVRRWVARYRMQTLESMQSVQAKAFLFADAALTQGNANGNFQLVERAIRVTPAEIRAAANRYLTGDRVIMNLIPIGKLDLISKPELPWTNASRK